MFLKNKNAHYIDLIFKNYLYIVYFWFGAEVGIIKII